MKSLLSLLALLCSLPALAQMRPPSFMGGIPGLAQSRALDMQRHQARTLLYREALEELKRNPAAADVPECGAEPSKALCLAKPAEAPTETGGGRRLALLVANMAYPPPIPALDTPGADVAKIGEDWAGGDWPVDGTEGYDGRLRVVGEPIVWLRSGGKSGYETSSGPLGRPGR